MNPCAQRIAIAEACGWKIGDKPRDNVWWKDGQWAFYEDLPDYVNDLNAMRDAWYNCIDGYDELEDAFTHFLLRSTGCSQDGDGGTPKEPNYCLSDICLISNATASERAEAFLKTLNIWQIALPSNAAKLDGFKDRD